jgi:ketosteroid isomerase-like protein
MDKLTEHDRRQIEQIHSSWIEFEIAGANDSLMTLCSDDIEFFPPDGQPVCGRAEVAAQNADANFPGFALASAGENA